MPNVGYIGTTVLRWRVTPGAGGTEAAFVGARDRQRHCGSKWCGVQPEPLLYLWGSGLHSHRNTLVRPSPSGCSAVKKRPMRTWGLAGWVVVSFRMGVRSTGGTPCPGRGRRAQHPIASRPCTSLSWRFPARTQFPWSASAHYQLVVHASRNRSQQGNTQWALQCATLLFSSCNVYLAPSKCKPCSQLQPTGRQGGSLGCSLGVQGPLLSR